LATGFGLGLIPKAPGTFGSLLGIPLGITLGLLPLEISVSTLVLLSLISIFIIKEAEKEFNSHDPSAIVIDEIIGQAIPLMFVAATFQNIAISFFLFRVFDIFKRGPVGFVDKNLKGATGVLADDIVAGIIALASILLINNYLV
jgi:phosphatidylglycerophosphatase A